MYTMGKALSISMIVVEPLRPAETTNNQSVAHKLQTGLPLLSARTRCNRRASVKLNRSDANPKNAGLVEEPELNETDDQFCGGDASVKELILVRDDIRLDVDGKQ